MTWRISTSKVLITGFFLTKGRRLIHRSVFNEVFHGTTNHENHGSSNSFSKVMSTSDIPLFWEPLLFSESLNKYGYSFIRYHVAGGKKTKYNLCLGNWNESSSIRSWEIYTKSVKVIHQAALMSTTVLILANLRCIGNLVRGPDKKTNSKFAVSATRVKMFFLSTKKDTGEKQNLNWWQIQTKSISNCLFVTSVY